MSDNHLDATELGREPGRDERDPHGGLGPQRVSIRLGLPICLAGG
jgi:hypothetical protein